MASSEELLRLAKFTSALVTNSHGVPYLLELLPGRHHKKTRYSVLLKCKRYRDALNCISHDECGDDFCKCNWTQDFLCVGLVGEDVRQLVTRATSKAEGLCWCKNCSVVAPTTQDRLCFSCVVTSLASPPKSQCCICHEEQRSSFLLDCSHVLCGLCSRKLLEESTTEPLCPCCRRQLPRVLLAAHVPSCGFIRADLP